MKNIVHIVKNILFMLRYIVKYVPGLIVFSVLLNIFSGLVSALTGTYVAKFILDSLQMNRPMNQVVVFLVLIVSANVGSSVLEAYYTEMFYAKRVQILRRKMSMQLYEKAAAIELSCYDNPEFYNDFVWAGAEADSRALEVLNHTGLFLKVLAQAAGILAIIASIDFVGIAIVALLGLANFGIALAVNKKRYALNKATRPLQRKRDYTSRVLYRPQYAKEIRLSNVKKKLIANFSETNRLLIKKMRQYGMQMCVLRLLYRLFDDLVMIGVYSVYLIWRVLVAKTVTYGSFMALFMGCREFRGSMSSLVSVLTSFQNNSMYIDRFRRFLEYEPKMEEGAALLPEGDLTLSLNDVSFQYEGGDRPALQHINLTIHPREKVALVGYNGAGKSTLVKLLMRLYDVSGGSVCVNGRDIRSFAQKSYRDAFGVVFQDYRLFAATIAENVMMDEVEQKDRPVIEQALAESDFTEKLAALPKGADTMLTRMYDEDGIELSGGEAQKVAIARIFPRNSRIVILDEPSSALDPVTEYYVNESMLRAAKDKTIVYISHRLSTTRMADRIIMLGDGRILEEGSHDELMALGGKYAEMFRMQADKYRKGGIAVP